MLQIEGVLDELDHGKEEGGIPLPVKEVVYALFRIILKGPDPPVVRRGCKHDNRHGGLSSLDPLGKLLHPSRVEVQHRYDQIE